jgi:hypothetical protein
MTQFIRPNLRLRQATTIRVSSSNRPILSQLVKNRDYTHPMSLMHIPPGGGFASKRVFQERRKVRFMYRGTPHNKNDSGWRFFKGL